jgi:hypothetical protein
MPADPFLVSFLKHFSHFCRFLSFYFLDTKHLEMSQSSEGYRSSAEIDHEVDKIIADTFKIPLIPKEKKERNIIERPRKGSILTAALFRQFKSLFDHKVEHVLRRNIDDFVRSAISLSDNCTKHVTERKVSPANFLTRKRITDQLCFCSG